ncbi:MAG: helix-turn-helix transcriptional regulator [Acetobacteraceae bacterium]|nr:helix-turn-helix transcriptional regulator [Acetobacteraceae bacterium]MCX7686330.1 helix-turn-helix transcriptional regulator [Acetobacteraceae bacterium]MDW8399040.1 helix-turn-helix transcriptional regulator [Acetobacteraceae bacterium]
MEDHPHPAAEEEAAFLAATGRRLRRLRSLRGVTRRDLARRSGVSERYIAQIEAGAGNISILLLRRIARPLGVGLAEILGDSPEPSAERRLLEQLVADLPESALAEARALLAERFGRPPPGPRAARIALIGLRGAGKSTLGAALAKRLGVAFVELDAEVEREGGSDLADIFARHGQEGFRRLERAALSRLVASGQPMVIAAGGGIVADAATYALLLDSCVTVWLRARPEEHMARVLAQGDTRPMRDNRDAMADLRAILAAREELYAKADIELDTSGRTPEACLADLLARLPGRAAAA